MTFTAAGREDPKNNGTTRAVAAGSYRWPAATLVGAARILLAGHRTHGSVRWHQATRAG
jgi:hypothetical protein